MDKLKSPCAYQGGKQRISDKIINEIILENDLNNINKFYDLCSGSGAISLNLIHRGFPKENLVMLDAGPWGLFWELIGKSEFDLKVFKKYLDSIPKDLNEVKGYMEELYRENPGDDKVYKFLLLQASAFGSKAIWLGEDNQWKNGTFRSYWQPTKTSSRKSPVNPMMPLPNSLYERVEKIVNNLNGITGIFGNIELLIDIEENSVVYIDPPYKNTTGYGYNFLIEKYIVELVRKNRGKNIKIYVSEGIKLCDNAVLLESSLKKGGINGLRESFNEEWVSKFFI